MADLKLTLSIIEGDFAVCRLSPRSDIPAWAVNDTFFSITRTLEELSIICPGHRVPEGERQEAGWRCLKVEGPLDFSMVGAMAALAAPLGDAGISLLAVATFDTDYLLVREKDFERAVAELSGAGHTVRA
jgi:hypothetical protein